MGFVILIVHMEIRKVELLIGLRKHITKQESIQI